MDHSSRSLDEKTCQQIGTLNKFGNGRETTIFDTIFKVEVKACVSAHVRTQSKTVFWADSSRKARRRVIPMVTVHGNIVNRFFKLVHVVGHVRYNEDCCI